MKIKVAVIGVGSMGRNHARVYSELPGAKLVAVSDAANDLAKEVSLKYGVSGYSDFRLMLEKERPDAVSVVVPTAMHEEVALAALEAGAHVLVEKPIASNLEEGKRIIAAAKKLDRKLMVGHIVRFNPAVRELKKRLEANEAGRIFQVVCRRVGPFPARIRDVGVVIDLAPHDIDLMRFLTGMNPERVYAEIERNVHTKHEDLVLGLLHFPKGIIGALEINWLTPTKVREITVLGERGMFRVDDLTQDLFFFENAETNGELWPGLGTIKGVSEGRMTRHSVNRYEPLRAELEAFVESIAENKPVPITGEDGLQALGLALSLIEAGKSNQVVTVN